MEETGSIADRNVVDDPQYTPAYLRAVLDGFTSE